MILCTECYIQKDGKTLMLHRNKKDNDINQGKWIGLGGKFESGESPKECLLREVKEEAGVTLLDFDLRGVITFITSDKEVEPMYIFIFTASEYSGEIGQCKEGTLKWIDTDKIFDLNLWEGDRLFWEWMLTDKGFFMAKFVYHQDKLVEHEVNFY